MNLKQGVTEMSYAFEVLVKLGKTKFEEKEFIIKRKR